MSVMACGHSTMVSRLPHTFMRERTILREEFEQGGIPVTTVGTRVRRMQWCG
jgi:hypothetical protein